MILKKKYILKVRDFKHKNLEHSQVKDSLALTIFIFYCRSSDLSPAPDPLKESGYNVAYVGLVSCEVRLSTAHEH